MTILARRYAQSFFDTFHHDLSQDVINKLNHVILFLTEHKRSFCLHFIPYYSKDSARHMLNVLLFDEASLPPSFGKLIELLLHDGRIMLVVSIFKEIVRIYYQRNKIYSFCITSSHPLNESQVESIKKFIAYKLNSTIIVTYQRDASLIAGIRLQSTLYLWEYSIRKSLETIHNKVMNKIRYG